ncbi:putative Polyketide synthase modules and related protein [Desulfamplus magnetovallimortis]|uniref:Putative Polyketide synthase modules and related protein n=1 Tax=Desulfamplus magnetovallimortis TaxID=1246637 RepID=L0R5N6_9BACT|nr:type I polyketide synthase [Desulfamplus magnetovallimortis]CCO06840.1 putative Polyketide synthase modules and related protein [Desulfamplus magnetovallimortis BW-1]SLM32891.1 putative Polyketide synthase modules and related protein [Desulfamplus magnetovallimortis]
MDNTKNQDVTTLGKLLRARAKSTPNKKAYSYLKNGLDEAVSFTYGQLDEAVRATAASIPDKIMPGDRVLILYPPGVDFLIGFFGALYAGLVPIPVPPPDPTRLKRTLPRLMSIVRDAQAPLVMTTKRISEQMSGSDFDSLHILATDAVDRKVSELWDPTHMDSVNPDDLAYLQYTSGSTGTPKGVMLDHGTVLYHLGLLQRMFRHTPESVSVVWMPNFHDYGLVDGLLEPLYNGTPCYIISPITFIKNPFVWLKAIDIYGGTHTQAPNFAFERCILKISEEQKKDLNLSTMRVASNGAEPIRRETVFDFISTFVPCGFPPRAFFQAYGMAEATLAATTKPYDGPIEMCHVDAFALEHEYKVVPPGGSNKNIEPVKIESLEQISALKDSPELTLPNARWIVSCGIPYMNIVIAHVKTLERCADGEVGEIWISDPSVASGYWQKPEETYKTFAARLSDAPEEGPFLRTGDLGFMLNGQMYFTGRLKDLIIIDGVNHYPQDIEWTVEECHPAIRPGQCVAFSVEEDCQEKLVILAEVNPMDNWDELFSSVRKAVAEHHELTLHTFVALKKGGIYKTSSGKVQRRGSKTAFINDNLDSFAVWNRPKSTIISTIISTEATDKIRSWLIKAVSKYLSLPEHAVDPSASFADHGMNSRTGVELAGEMERWLGREISHTLMWEYPNIDTLSRFLGGSLEPHEAVCTIEDQSGCDNPIAVVSMALRFPGADTPEQFWEILKSCSITVGPWTESRMEDSHGSLFKEGTGPGKITSLRGGFIKNPDLFDAELFGIVPKEAEIMDPQQRILLEVAWETFERAGINSQTLSGTNTGVFIGISTDDYSFLQMGNTNAISAYTGPAKALSISANRISYQFDLKGPSMSIDTACSSSLVALHQACQSLRNGESSMALAGGVNLILSPHMSIALSQASLMAPDGLCKTFDESANGYVRGEGCGLLLLKRLSDAQRDGDNILGVIHGSAINQDGHSNGLTAPNGLAQQQVIKNALAAAGLSPRDIGYVETHGTGTTLGDPIEVKAIQAVLGEGRDLPAGQGDGNLCVLGAVKANIGHLESAAGVAGVIKAILCLNKGEIPPQPSFNKLNPRINIENTPFHIPKESFRWPEGKTSRFAGVSSFGFGGANAHMIISSPPKLECINNLPHTDSLDSPIKKKESDADKNLMVLSAVNEQALGALALKWSKFISNHKNTPDNNYLNHQNNLSIFRQWCHNAATRRTKLPCRLAITGDTPESIQVGLKDYAISLSQSMESLHMESIEMDRGILETDTTNIDGKSSTTVIKQAKLQTAKFHGVKPSIAFFFTGQGSQYPGMGKKLYENEPVFKNAMDQCDKILTPMLGRSLVELLYGDNPASKEELAETLLTQPVVCAIEYALAKMWMAWGVKPDVVLGHSVGEYMAACIAGVFSLEDALKLVSQRARLVNTTEESGSMVSVSARKSSIKSIMESFNDPKLSIGCYNTPGSHVLSGPSATLEKIADLLESQGIEARLLPVSHAFHSPLMEPIMEGFRDVASKIEYHPPAIPIYSNVSGTTAGSEMASHEYWVNHLRAPVRFSDSVQALLKKGVSICLEIGPKPVLIALARQIADEISSNNLGTEENLESGTTLESDRALESGTNLENVSNQWSNGADQFHKIAWLPTLRPRVDDRDQVMESLGTMFIHGVSIDWHKYYGRSSSSSAMAGKLPTYPFQKKRYWLDTDSFQLQRKNGELFSTDDFSGYDFPGKMTDSPLLDKVLFEKRYDTQSMPWIGEHRVFGTIVLPGASHISLIMEAAIALLGRTPFSIKDIMFSSALTVPDNGSRMVHLVMDRVEEDGKPIPFTLASRDALLETRDKATWQEHAVGYLTPGTKASDPVNGDIRNNDIRNDGIRNDYIRNDYIRNDYIRNDYIRNDYKIHENILMQTIKDRCSLLEGNFYKDIWQPAISLGPHFSWVDSIWKGEGEVLAKLVRPQGENPKKFTLSPGLIDSMLQVLTAIVKVGNSEAAVPFSFENFEWYGSQSEDVLWSHVVLRRDADARDNTASHDIISDVTLMAEDGKVIARARGFRAWRVKSRTLLGNSGTSGSVLKKALYHINWNDMSVPFFDHSVGQTSPPGHIEMAGEGENNAKRVHSKDITPLTDINIKWLLINAVPKENNISTEKSVSKSISKSVEINQDLINLLKEHGIEVVKLDAPENSTITTNAVTAILKEKGQFQRVIYHAGKNSNNNTGKDNNKMENIPDPSMEAVRHCTNLYTVIQAIMEENSNKDHGDMPYHLPGLGIITHGAQAVLKGDVPDPSQAALWGMAKVLRMENPDLRCRCIDLKANASKADAIAMQLSQMLIHDNDIWDRALRGDILLQAEIAPLPYGELFQPAQQPGTAIAQAMKDSHISSEATYLVSGGTGSLGQGLVKWLTEQGARHIIITGRREPSATLKDKIQEFAQSGITILPLQVDIRDFNALKRAVDQAMETLPPIKGVFHLAGVLDDALTLKQNFEKLTNVIEPKVKGAWNLHRIMADQDHDIFICFSSAAGLMGSMGQGNYAAANAAMDAFMAWRRNLGLPGLAIQWGPWSEGGMAASMAKQDQERFKGYGISPVNPSDAFELLTDIFHGGKILNGTDALNSTLSRESLPLSSMGVLSVDWNVFIPNIFRKGSPLFFKTVEKASQSNSNLRSPDSKAPSKTDTVTSNLAEEIKSLSPQDGETMLDKHLRKLVANALGIANPSSIGPRQRLFDLGLDSLGAVELKNQLAASLGATLRPTLFFDFPTLAALMDHLKKDILQIGHKEIMEVEPEQAGEEFSTAELTESLEGMSEDALAALLADELKM